MQLLVQKESDLSVPRGKLSRGGHTGLSALLFSVPTTTVPLDIILGKRIVYFKKDSRDIQRNVLSPEAIAIPVASRRRKKVTPEGPCFTSSGICFGASSSQSSGFTAEGSGIFA